MTKITLREQRAELLAALKEAVKSLEFTMMARRERLENSTCLRNAYAAIAHAEGTDVRRETPDEIVRAALAKVGEHL